VVVNYGERPYSLSDGQTVSSRAYVLLEN